MQYKTRAGAYKIFDTNADQSLYGQITVINDSAQDIVETFQFELKGFTLVDSNGGPTTHTVNCPPGQKRTILFHRKSDVKGSVTFKAGMSNKLTVPKPGPNIRKPSNSPNKPKVSPNKPKVSPGVSPRQNKPAAAPAAPGVATPSMNEDKIVAKMKTAKHLRPKAIEKGKKVFLTEHTEGDNVFLLFVNDEPTLNLKARYEFKCDDWALVEPTEPNVFEFELPAGEQIVKQLGIVPKAAGKKGGGGMGFGGMGGMMGGMGGMGGIGDMYGDLNRSYKIVKTKFEFYE